jgi:20S proteasome subunit alpha 2
VSKGETAIGVKATNGVVLAVEKKLSSVLIDQDSYHKINVFASNIGATYAGLGPDYRILG